MNICRRTVRRRTVRRRSIRLAGTHRMSAAFGARRFTA